MKHLVECIWFESPALDLIHFAVSPSQISTQLVKLGEVQSSSHEQFTMSSQVFMNSNDKSPMFDRSTYHQTLASEICCCNIIELSLQLRLILNHLKLSCVELNMASGSFAPNIISVIVGFERRDWYGH